MLLDHHTGEEGKNELIKSNPMGSGKELVVFVIEKKKNQWNDSKQREKRLKFYKGGDPENFVKY